MSRELKIILAVVAGLLFLCFCGVVAGFVLFQRVSTSIIKGAADPTAVAEVVNQIATWDVPPGYEQNAAGLLGLKMVFINPPDDKTGHIITLVQVPASTGLSRQQVEEQLQGTIAERLQRQGMAFQEVGEDTITIRGQQVTLTVREGQDENGEALRQVSGVFGGNGGPALLLITAPESVWDPDFVAEFIASIQ